MNKNINSYEQFCNAVAEGIRNYLPERFSGADVSLQTVTKNNNLKLTGLMVRIKDNNICPNIYLEKFYEEYQNREDMDEIMRKIAEIRIEKDFDARFDAKKIIDFDLVRHRIVPRLINKDMNESLLKERPHTLLEDLAVIYVINLGFTKDNQMSTPVTYDLMRLWSITVEELHELAVNNLTDYDKGTFMKLTDVINNLAEDHRLDFEYDEDTNSSDMETYVLSNKSKIYGAAEVLNIEVMRRVWEKLGDEFYILPSSVHELLFIKKSWACDPNSLRNMVIDVNREVVDFDEILSNNIYTWTIEDGLKIYQ